VQPRRDGLAVGVAGGGLLVVELVAEARVALQRDERRAAPLHQAVRAGAHRMLHDRVAVHLGHLARDRARVDRFGELERKARARMAEADAQRVAVDHLQALDRLVVVERRIPALRAFAQRLQAEDVVGQQPGVGGAVQARVEVALERVRIVLGGQLARAAVEGGIVGEEDAGADLQGELAEVGRHLRQRRRRRHAQPGGAREQVVAQRRLDDVVDDLARVGVRGLRRIEPRLGHLHRVAQHLLRRGRLREGARRRHARGERGELPATTDRRRHGRHGGPMGELT
jgi:hypothetical protein